MVARELESSREMFDPDDPGVGFLEFQDESNAKLVRGGGVSGG